MNLKMFGSMGFAICALGYLLLILLMYLNKKQTWALADELGYLDYVYNNTHTCYNGVEGGCHECPACKLREEGYRQYMEEKQGVANV